MIKNGGKLITNEDKFHFHKILGLSCLLHFIYRYCKFIFEGSMGFNTNYDAYLVCIHMLLGMSSLIFRISSFRHTKLPIIYPELRLHNILFTMRSVVCFYLCYYEYPILYRMIACLLTNIGADIITCFLKQGTTIRDVIFYEGITERAMKRERLEYSDAQLAATIVMLGSCDMIFGTLLAIQIAPFTMTLVKKGIIGGKSAHLTYAYALLINYILVIYNTTYIVKFAIMKIIAAFMRFRFNINKYLMWIFLFALYYVTFEYQFKENIYFNIFAISYVILRRLYKLINLA